MLAFTLSLDDFTISYFTTSPVRENLSTLIYSAARKGIKPSLNALSALTSTSPCQSFFSSSTEGQQRKNNGEELRGRPLL